MAQLIPTWSICTSWQQARNLPATKKEQTTKGRLAKLLHGGRPKAVSDLRSTEYAGYQERCLRSSVMCAV